MTITKKVQCVNKHTYDTLKFRRCPRCARKAEKAFNKGASRSITPEKRNAMLENAFHFKGAPITQWAGPEQEWTLEDLKGK